MHSTLVDVADADFLSEMEARDTERIPFFGFFAGSVLSAALWLGILGVAFVLLR